MKKKRDSKHPGKVPEDVGVKFELEPDAEQLFLESVEGLAHSNSWINKLKDDVDKGRDQRPAVSKKPREIDLHGMTLAGAEIAIEQFLSTLIASTPGRITVRVITGKGRHSGPDGGVLPRGIHVYVRAHFGDSIERIDESPADVALNGLPIRGHFDVVLRGKSR